MTTVYPDASLYRGRSLAYMRHLLNQTGPLFPDVTAFANAYAADLDPVLYPEIGQIVLFAVGKHGDIGLYVGEGVALHLNPNGIPKLLPFDPGGTYLGAMWWPSWTP